MYPGVALLTGGVVLSAALAVRPIVLPWFTLDIHTMLYLSVAACLGLQMVLFAAVSSAHAVAIGILPRIPRGLAWVRRMSLERALLVGLALLAAGFALALYSVVLWSQDRFHAIDPATLMRVAIPAAMLMLAGGQVCMVAFLMEYIRLRPSVRGANQALSEQ
jgi:hypothetical protein